MIRWNIRTFIIFCALVAFVDCGRKLIRHYGRCDVEDEIGYCQHRHQCWETEPKFSNSTRSQCPSQIRGDLVCCRRATAGGAPTPLKQLLPQRGVCGTIDDLFANRVTAGTIASIRDFPWMALLRSTTDDEEYVQRCGGSLIHERWVLTAAHCAPAPDNSRMKLQVRLGEWNTTSAVDCQRSRKESICAPPHIDIDVDRIIVHEDYVPPGSTDFVINDIALLRLSHSAIFTDFVMPICLPAANGNDEHGYTDFGLDFAGWGNTEFIRLGGSPLKMRAVVNAWSTASCRRNYPQLVSGQLCAGGETPVSSCGGDSGGPLMYKVDAQGIENSTYYLVGIVSLGNKRCINHGLPMVFTRVEHYVPWVIGTIISNT